MTRNISLVKESIAFSWHLLRANNMRSLLSLLGVCIGIFSIIAVLALVDSLKGEMNESFDMIGSDLLFIQKWPMGGEGEDGSYEWWQYMNRRQPGVKEMYMLEQRLQLAEAVAFQSVSMKPASYKNNSIQGAAMTGVTQDYNRVINLDIKIGRYFTPVEFSSGAPVAIIGEDIRQQLFGSSSAVGKTIKIGTGKIRVIGVFEKEGSALLGNGFDKVVMVPINYGMRYMDVKKLDNSISIKAKNLVPLNELKAEVTSHYRNIRKLKLNQRNDFSTMESSMISKAIDSVFEVVTLVGWIIGGFSIWVGGFSITNIMFVAVRERTPMIGIQKALGAKNMFILSQFLFESIALCLLGGAIGLLLLLGIITMFNQLFPAFTILLSLKNIGTGMLISTVIGVLAGIVPALKASHLDPVDAIRAK